MLVAVVAVLALGSVSRADTVTAAFNGVSPGSSISVAFNGVQLKNISAGVLNWNYVSGNTFFSPNFKAFCLEVAVGISSPTTFTVQDLSSRFSTTTVGRLQEFWGENFSSIGTNGTNAAAFQLGIWEIVSDGSLDLNNGSFSASSSSAKTVAQQWLNNVNGTGPMETRLIGLDATGSQDLITFGPPTSVVPVPPAAVLAGMGLISLVGYGIRRRVKVAK